MSPEAQSTDPVMFRDGAPLQLKDIRIELCDPDEYDLPTMMQISETHSDAEPDYCVFIDVKEAVQLRDWLNTVLP